MLFELETIGDPDDGMISAYTGCVDGNGEKKIAVINLNRVRTAKQLRTETKKILIEEKRIKKAVNKFISEIEKAHKMVAKSKLKFD